ncbi:MAG: bifunctional pyr operon transcriptional regulator/uracil phosphoribosyltransferase PyrR [Candidatus Ornithospirochaeta sp.]
MERRVEILDEMAVKRALMRLSYEIIEKSEDLDNLVLAGIRTRGLPIAQIIRDNIRKNTGKEIPICTLDITFYRDDLSRKGDLPLVKDSVFPVSIDNREVILCDDVLYTGRTARAAIDAVFAQGRPRRISLCVLIDRGHRELPIRPDYIGKNVPTSQKEVIKVSLNETDGKTGVEIVEKEGGQNS